jgi:hypothetical protein
VKAVRHGEIFYGYDTKFLFAEVNGDRVHWTVDQEGNMTPVAIEETIMGKFISTKAVGTISREDLTNAYKFNEGIYHILIKNGYFKVFVLKKNVILINFIMLNIDLSVNCSLFNLFNLLQINSPNNIL